MNNKFKFISAVLMSAALAAALCGCSEDGGNSAGNDSEAKGNVVYYDSTNSYVDSNAEEIEKQQKAMENAEKVEGKIGQDAEIKGCRINLKRVVDIGERPADDLHPEAARMYAAEVEVKNETDAAIDVSALGDLLVSVDGSNAVVGADLNAILAAQQLISGYQTLEGTAESGETVSGYMTFTAPKEWKEIKVSYVPTLKEGSYDMVEYTVTPGMIEEL